MNKKLEQLRNQNNGFKFAKSLIETIKENKEFGSLFEMGLESEYVVEMVKEIAKDSTIVVFNKEKQRLQDVSLTDLTHLYNNSKDNKVVDYYGWVNDPVFRFESVMFYLTQAYVITDLKGYSEYLISFDIATKEERIAALEASIKKTENNHADMIRLGLQLYEVKQLEKIRKIELQRGTEVKKEEVRGLLEIL